MDPSSLFPLDVDARHSVLPPPRDRTRILGPLFPLPCTSRLPPQLYFSLPVAYNTGAAFVDVIANGFYFITRHQGRGRLKRGLRAEMIVQFTWFTPSLFVKYSLHAQWVRHTRLINLPSRTPVWDPGGTVAALVTQVVCP